MTILATLRPYPALFTIRALVKSGHDIRRCRLLLLWIYKGQRPFTQMKGSKRPRCLTRGVERSELQRHRNTVYGLEGICCHFWWYSWRTFLQQTEPHTHTQSFYDTQTIAACCKRSTLSPSDFGHYYKQCGLRHTHTTSTSKWVSVSRTFWYMRKKHNSRQGVMRVTLHDYISYCLFSLSPLAFTFFVPFCPCLLWSF